MSSKSTPQSKILNLRLILSNYPILGVKIREQMRREMFANRIISPGVLEEEAEKKALDSQRLEGLGEVGPHEGDELWQQRLNVMRDHLTDFYFAYNLPINRFHEIVQQAVDENRPGPQQPFVPAFNPELAPTYLLFDQAEKYATAPLDLYEDVKHHLKEIVVVLLKSIVSDQLAFVRIARQFIDIFDLKQIRDRKIGRGKIGGKAAGMLLAYKILTQPDETDAFDLRDYVAIPDTYFLGSDVYYEFKTLNELEYTASLKYRSHQDIERAYPRTRERYLKSRFPEDAEDRLRELLIKVGSAPLIVRSSSLLEDNFGSAFAGKYDSYFLPNQGTLEENLTALEEAIVQVYASVLKPDAIFYRQIQGLDDYDERMAVLIQTVQGQRHERYFFPVMAGVGFSRNPFIWHKRLERKSGFLRLVLGLGTRAVDRVDHDYPRMIGLSHPQLRPEKNASDIRRYSQRSMDVIDVEKNELVTIPVTEVLSSQFPGIQYLASLQQEGYVQPMYTLGKEVSPRQMILTFDNLLKSTDFVKLMRNILQKLERHYERPVDIEFTVELIPGYPKPRLKIYLLQCRPLSNQDWPDNVVIPTDVPAEAQIFSATHLVPMGIVNNIKYIVYVDPVAYSQQADTNTQVHLARMVGRLNKALEDEQFILMGPGRWGSSNIDLGVKVSYADIYNTRMLIEIAVARDGATPEVSHGTHFFQDLVESQIYPLSLYPDNANNVFNHAFLNQAPNSLGRLLPDDAAYSNYIRVINVPEVTSGKYLRVTMNAEKNMALGYLSDPQN